MNRNLNELLKWGIENTTNNPSSENGANGAAPAAGQPTPGSTRDLNPEILAALFGGPSDAELMKAAMEVVTNTDPAVTLDDKLTAFDNFEQLIESLDNANNMESLSLWTPLLSMLEHQEDELRRMAAWCVGTAVQNNQRSQERLLAMGGIPRLVSMATDGAEKEATRRKAIYALSSAVRNYQPAMDVATEALAKQGHHDAEAKVDAKDMDAVDQIMSGLREKAISSA